MAREGTFFGYLKDHDVLAVPLYNLVSAAVFLTRMDNSDATGGILVRIVIPKTYNYDSLLLYVDNPAALYSFPLNLQAGRIPLVPGAVNLSTLSAAKETVSGRACILTAGNLQNGTYTVARLQGQYAMVPPLVQVQDTFAGITTNDGAGSPWALEFWVYRAATTLQTVYLEANAGVTSYFQCYIDTAGHVNLSQSGTIRYTGTQTIGLNAWHHVVLVYNGTQIIAYLDDIPAAGVAYTHGTYTSITLNRINHSPANSQYTQSLAVYGYALTAAQVDRHWLQIAGNDYESGIAYTAPGTMGQGGGGVVMFGNNGTPFSIANPTAGGPNFGMVLPLLGVAFIQGSNTPANSVWFYALQTFEKEGVE